MMLYSLASVYEPVERKEPATVGGQLFRVYSSLAAITVRLI